MVRSWIAALAAVVPAVPLVAQWTPVPVTSAPLPPSGAALVPWTNGELLMFGGQFTGPASPEWSWDGLRWASLSTPVPQRSRCGMARNDGDDSLLVFGGFNSIGNGLADTWRFAGGSWTQLFPAVSPPAGACALAHEPGTSNMILVTMSAVSPLTSQTWRFAGGSWTQVNTFQPSAPELAMFTDTVRGEVCLVDVGSGNVSVSRLVGTNWLEVHRTAAAPGRPMAAFDIDRGRALVLMATSLGIDTFEYDGVKVLPRPAAALPLPFFIPVVAYHRERKESVLLARFASGSQLTVLRWLEGPVPMATPFGASCVSPAFQLGLLPGDSPQPGGSHRLVATGANSAAITLSAIGFSHVQFGAIPLPQPIPLGSAGCELRVEPLLIDVLGIGLPATRLITLPNSSALLGVRYDAQCVQFDASGVTDASNGLEVQIGLPLPENTLLETFASAQRRDAVASGDGWGNGSVTPVAIGGDGKHGSFDATLGTSLGGGVYEWNTDNMTLPANVTLTGNAELVTDGRFYFTDFVVPAGVTVRFVGSAPARVFVRGQVAVQGTVVADAADMPAVVPTSGPLAGQRVSSFNARNGAIQTLGQPGGRGGAGGGSGGDGGRECLGFGPIVLGGLTVTDGQPGSAVQVAAGHAYAAQTVGTGGSGSPMNPPSGLLAAAGAPFIVSVLTYRDEFSPGGSGGGFLLPGGVPTVPVIPPYVGVPSPTQPANGTAPTASAAFGLLPFPANPPVGYQSMEHFLVGGSGGGGGGSHTFGIPSVLATEPAFMSGHGGSGGGGAVALRAGGDVAIQGSITSRGGRGVIINGDNPATPTQDVDLGVSSPGGGGSGGSVVVQSARSVSVQGTIDTSGGAGSRTSNVAVLSLAPFALNVQAQAGAGSPGFYRLEAGNGVTFTGSGVPAFSSANSGALSDQDNRTGSRSTWLLPPAAALPYYLRYELVVDVAGQTLLYSDDPAVSPLAANDPNGPVVLRFQGASLDPVTGAPVAGSLGPWRTALRPGSDSVNQDRASLLRFDLVVAKAAGNVQVREVRIVWR